MRVHWTTLIMALGGIVLTFALAYNGARAEATAAGIMTLIITSLNIQADKELP